MRANVKGSGGGRGGSGGNGGSDGSDGSDGSGGSGSNVGAVLPAPLTAESLAAAEAEPDPGSLAAGSRLRDRYGPEQAAAAIDQAVLRRRAVVKFGPRAASMFFTADGLEQATRPALAAYHAQRLAESGATRVIDLGCGIGTDAGAFADAGLQVIAVEIDPHTAEVARANLAGRAEVITGDAEQLAAELITDSDAVFIDPARRTTSGRVWRIEDFRPRWSLVTTLLQRRGPTGVKLGPALPHREIPAGVEAEWISDQGETVEVALWTGPGTAADRRSALLLPDRRLVGGDQRPPVGTPGRFLYEPDGAVIRAGAIGALADRLEGWVLDPQIAYLSADRPIQSDFATGFEIIDVLPYKEKVLRGWVREHQVGTLEIKKRGIEIDPATLRKRLRPGGPQQATMIISRTPDGARTFICRRLAP